MTKYSTKGKPSGARTPWPKAKAKRAKKTYKRPTAARVAEKRAKLDFETRLALLILHTETIRKQQAAIFYALEPRQQKLVSEYEEE